MAAGRMDHPAGLAAALEFVRCHHHCVSGLPARNHEPADSPARSSLDQPLLECLGRRDYEYRAGRVVADLPTASGVPDDRRGRADDLPETLVAKKIAAMGYGRRCGKGSAD